MTFVPDRYARIVIIGGGAIGCSVAYQLARAGENDVLVLEKAQITEGCTWHAAGLVGQLRGKRNLTRLMQNSVAVYDRLEEESGQAIDWNKAGSLRLAGSDARWAEIRRSMTQARSFGFECHDVSIADAQKMFPYIKTDGLVGAAFIPSDGYVDPYSLTQAYAKAARAYGARIQENALVTDIVTSARRIEGVVTDNGNIGCEILVNCAGLWAKRVGDLAGVALAAGVVEHQYFVTEKSLEFNKSLPTLRDPDNNFYLKPDVGAFAIGGWEEGSKSCWNSRPPFDFGRELFEENIDRLEKFALPAASRLPVLNDIGVQTIINGPIPVSADGEPIMGISPQYDNFYLACGFTAGIAASGGAGEAMAAWILEGDPGMDLWPFDVRRFTKTHANGAFLDARAVDAYAAYYKIHWPGGEVDAARGVRRSPLYDRLKEAGAVYGSKAGWERANWFAPDGIKALDEPSFEGKPNWFGHVGEEVKAVRERVALVDQTSFSKFEISGPGAFDALQNIAANDLSGGVGRCVYTQLCNENGGIEADLTIMQVGTAQFYVVTGSGFSVRDRHWIETHLPCDGSVVLRDVTSAYAVINLCGPKARDVLSLVSRNDMSNEALPFLSCKEIEIGNGYALAARVGYVGELGWELHIPTEFAAHIYDLLWEAGQRFDIANAGYRAVESCRLEKGYVYWSAEISPDYTPYEAGLGFCVAMKKGTFIGRDALRKVTADGPARKLCTFIVEKFAPLHGSEAIMHNGRVVGLTSSAGYGHYLGHSIAFGYLPVELARETEFEIEAFGESFAARRGPRCLYDAKAERLRA